MVFFNQSSIRIKKNVHTYWPLLICSGRLEKSRDHKQVSSVDCSRCSADVIWDKQKLNDNDQFCQDRFQSANQQFITQIIV